MLKLVATLAIASTTMVFLSACSSAPDNPLPRPESVDLQRFMGDWYVIGFIPLPPESEAHNGIENYRLGDDGRIYTTYTFNKGSFDGPVKRYTPEATVVEGSDGTAWKMQFLWPFAADYRIAYVTSDYRETIIARPSRDYVWLMSRDPGMSDARYQSYVQRIEDMGYDVSEFRRQPQQPLNER
ncbi:apolipoprotein D and lipocalin family protein [Litorivivens lipolytica]|uniref:Outer membrane lipoprotein Blc n=1 Tax=Litorivivens lipolytica TaxID=1524264 RepID=A0A7W4W537_9GAMM|nr:lipocalin family protein [Litorivivens lipolytica]MBB3047605.1 apolipoprotein D and lipocalin family protein [Litorivivens lipolytica]